MIADNWTDMDVSPFLKFFEQLDEVEGVQFGVMLNLMEEAKSKTWQTRRLHEFADWYRKRRGMPPRKEKA